MRAVACFSMGAFLAAAAWGQTAAEHAATTGAASAASAGAAGVGKSIGGVFGSVNGNLGKAGEAAGGSTAASSPAPASARPKPIAASKKVDPAEVTEGLERAELIKRFGQPVMRVSEGDDKQLVERFWYDAPKAGQVEIKLIDGKVASVLPPPAPKSAASKKQEPEPKN